MTASRKLHPKLAKARALSTADLDELIEASKFTQFQLGELVGIDDRAVRRLLDPERKRADRLDLKCALAERLGKERRSNEAIGGKPRTLLVSVEPPIQPSVDDAHGGQYASDEELAQGRAAVAALKLSAQSSGNRVHAEASSGGESAAEAPVAQPGSAPRFNVGEVARSNRASGSCSESADSVALIMARPEHQQREAGAGSDLVVTKIASGSRDKREYPKAQPLPNAAAGDSAAAGLAPRGKEAA